MPSEAVQLPSSRSRAFAMWALELHKEKQQYEYNLRHIVAHLSTHHSCRDACAAPGRADVWVAGMHAAASHRSADWPPAYGRLWL